MSSEPLWSLGLYAFLVLVTVGGMLGTAYVLGERHGDKPDRRGEFGRDMPYESGIVPTGGTQLRLPIQYYLIAMFFVIFDLEAVFIYTWAVAVPETGWTGFAEILVFIGVLAVALVYLWRVGALEWGGRYRRAVGHRIGQTHAVVEDERDRIRAAG